MLEFKTLGGIQLKLEGKYVQNNLSRKALALIVYLLINKKSASRDYLGELFWEGLSQTRGMNNLRVTLSEIRKILPDLLTIERHTVSINPSFDYRFDVNELKVSPDSANGTMGIGSRKIASQVQKKLSQYHGDFLEGFYIQGCSSFENWLVIEREQIRELVIAQLQELIDFYIAIADYQPGIKLLKKLLKLNPLLESAHRQLMRLFVFEDQREAALSQFETCKQILKNELDVEPSTETKEFIESIRAGELEIPLSGNPRLMPAFLEIDSDGKRDHPNKPLFVARERELEWLNGFLEKTLDGNGKVVFIAGGTGRGKTALITEFSRRAIEAHPNMLGAIGNCRAYSGVGDPYLPFREVMGKLTGDLESDWAAGIIPTKQAQRAWNSVPLAVKALLDHGPHLPGIFVDPKKLMSRALSASDEDASWLQELHAALNQQSERSDGLDQSYLFEQYTNVLRNLADTAHYCWF